MKCTHCNHTKLATYDTRHVADFVVRKRKCMSCDERFYTIESYMSEEQLEDIENLRRGYDDTGSESESQSTEDA